MARVDITVPDDLLRRARIAALDAYLRELEDELGPVTPDEQAAAEKWADRLRPCR